jgi:pSer/pThr/pTyr-binding forkhead associated (FHA) protein/outer membrane protein assembly factor BamD (BamD/ComL family)
MKVIARKEGEVVSKAEVKNETFYLGRSKQNDLSLPHPKISRRHAKIFFEDGQWFLEDLRSDNGTRYKGERVLKTNIRSGDRFSIGPYEMEFLASIPDKSVEQVTVTSYMESPEAVPPPSPPPPTTIPEIRPVETLLQGTPNILESPDEEVILSKDLSSGNFFDAIAVKPSVNEKLQSFIEEHSQDKLANAPKSESIHTVILEDPEHSLAEIAPNEDSVKTMIEFQPAERSLARLVYLDQEKLGKELTLNKLETVLGNDEKSDVRINSEDFPTRKAIIRSTDSTYVIETTDSESGAYVDGVPVRRRELENHDIIQVGKSRFEFLIGDSKSQVKKPKVIERPTRTMHLPYENLLSNWKALLVAGMVLGFLGILVLKTVSLITTKTEKDPKNISISKTSEETARVVLYHLTEAQRLIDEGKLDEAEVRVKIILGKVSPNDLDALRLLRKIQTMREEIRDKERAEKSELNKKQTEVQQLLEKHNKLLDERKFADAKKVQDKIIAIEGANPESTSKVEGLKAVTEQAKREAVADKRNNQELNKIYFQGVEEYENGNLGAAETMLKEVAQKNKHPYQASAKKILASIDKQLGSTVVDELKAAKAKLRTDDIVEGYETIRSLAKKYPGRADVKTALQDAKKQVEIKAKEIYRQGITMKEMAEDPSGAIDQFERVLRLLPDTSHEYHRKAKEQIQKLQISP